MQTSDAPLSRNADPGYRVRVIDHFSYDHEVYVLFIIRYLRSQSNLRWGITRISVRTLSIILWFIERTTNSDLTTIEHMRIDHCRFDIVMPHQFLDLSYIAANFQQLGGKRMAERYARQHAWLILPCQPPPLQLCDPAMCPCDGDPALGLGDSCIGFPGKTHCQRHSLEGAGYLQSSALST